MVATEGWADVSDVRAQDLARRFEDAGVAALLFTDVGRDGLLKGCNVEATVALAQAVAIPVIASGGVGNLQHLVDGIKDGRADAVLAASIFHFGTYTVQEAKAFMAAQGICVR